jgi:hypothetical protein
MKTTMKKSRVGALAVFICASTLADSSRQLPSLPDLHLTPPVAIPAALEARRDFSLRTLQVASMRPPRLSPRWVICGCHLGGIPYVEPLGQSGYIIMLADAMMEARSVDIFYGARYGKLYSSNENSDICGVFYFLVHVVMPEEPKFVELFEGNFSLDVYIKQTRFVPTCIFVLNGDKPASVQVDFEKKLLIISAAETWAAFDLDSTMCDSIEAFARARVIGDLAASQLAHR